MLFIVNIQQWSLDTMCGFNTPDHLKSQYFTSYGTKAFIGGSLQKILTTRPPRPIFPITYWVR